jgi:glycosyltransferase involved in cell wall biosynthesis
MSDCLFSVIIPTYARPKQLSDCLTSLSKLDYLRDRFEVIVVDDGSPTPLDAIVAPFQTSLNLTLLRQANAGPSAARNAGAAMAKGTFLAFTDDDCAPAPDWLRQLEIRFTKQPQQIVGGRTCNALTQNPFSCTSQLILDVVYEVYNAIPDQARFFTSNNLALPTKEFHNLGGFNVNFPTSEDRELCDRWLYQGYAMRYAQDAVVLHAHDLTLRSLWNQHFGYGQGAYRYHKLRSDRGSGKFKIERNFYLSLLHYALTQTQYQPRLLLLLLLFSVQVANAAGFFYEKFRLNSV